MPLAMALSSIVLPALGGETISPRWPRPMGAIRSITRVDRLLAVVSSLSWRLGKMAVSDSKYGRCLATSGSTPFTVSTRSRL